MSAQVATRTDTVSAEEVLTPEAIEFVTGLHREFENERRARLRARVERRERLAAGERLDFLESTRKVRDGDWTVAPAPPDLDDRRVEITGPTDAKMLINALNSGARCYMADFEDANTPTWSNMVEGQHNLSGAIDGTIEFTSPQGREYRLGQDVATLIVRPRGWHLVEKHVLVDEEPVSGSLFDFGLYLFHNAERLAERGSAPYFYLPKLESHLEARLWNDVFRYAQEALGLPGGTIRATVLIETLPAAFEMDEILYELREHASGLNAGRWDYIFSAIKCFRERAEFVLPDRNEVRMTVPFMHAYTELLVKTCHRRGAHAMGGMAALIPSRRDADANERAIAGVREDKSREATQGFDGTWVAHPDLVPVAREEFDRVLGSQPNQKGNLRQDVLVSAAELLDVPSTPGQLTEEGLRNDVSVGIQYIASWLRGNGAAAINNLMEDAATAEIARAQVWQWIRHGASLVDGRTVDRGLVRQMISQEVGRIREGIDPGQVSPSRLEDATEIFEELAMGDELAEFLTLEAYDRID